MIDIPDFTDIESLRKYLELQLMAVLEKEVFTEISNQIQESVVEKVYDKYSPTVYERTGKMASSKQIKLRRLSKNSIEITHERMDGSKNVSQIIEEGNPYSWTKSGISGTPRPFFKLAYYKIKNKNLHILAMIRGLKARGITATMG